MLLEVAALSKRFAARRAFKRLFPSVDPDVPFEVAALCKGFVAPGALERSITSVNARVLLQMAGG